ncbi:MAG: alpha/beta hydrolase [Rhodobacteraceae bacterium]|nr:alpha/beta hydrolase [Paracoccaceae bacterium]NNK68208.1 alpha/beta hydrolase [Paracoccaceae bacterium]
MASLHLHVVNQVCRFIVRPHLARTPTPEKAKADLDLTAKLTFPRPAGLTIRDEGELSWISAGPCADGQVILYLHGGGYIAGSPKTHAPMLGRLSSLSGVMVAAPDYPLAPGHAAPAQFDHAVAAHARLTAMGYAPDQIVVGGDSAGGGLALALVAHLCQTDQRPAGVFAFSPWTDLTLSGASIEANAARDRLFDVSRIREIVGYVAPSLATDDPRVSPLFADFPNPPPALIRASETEILFDDGRRIAEKLQAAGGEVSFKTLPDAPHVWPIFDGWMSEARETLREAAVFCRDVLSSRVRSTNES